MTEPTILLDGETLSLEGVARIARGGSRAELAPAAREKVRRARGVIERILESGEVVYGVNTGFGRLADVVIPKNELRQLQRNIVMSHAAGVGDPLPPDIVRATIVLRANCLAKGHSGIREVVLDALIAMVNAGIVPFVPEKGSVGASGDLAPLAHLALVLLGEGRCLTDRGEITGGEALRSAGIDPVVLEAKEGLALLNGTPVTAAIATLALLDAETLVETADVAGVLSWEALEGTDAAFDPAIHAARPHEGQSAAAAHLRDLVRDSEIRDSHRGCGRVQDAYSLRCMPQVHGAVRDTLTMVRRMLEIEINSATDNPLVFTDPDRVISGGNFHGEPIASAMDYLAIALGKLGSISERRIAAMMDPSTSGMPEAKDPVFARLPAFLTDHGGLNSGFMMAQVTAAALASENKTLAHPASADTIPTSANQEDHVSMSPIAARKARQVCENVRNILAIELLAAAQGVEYRQRDGRQLQPGVGGRQAYEIVRNAVPRLDHDPELSPDIAAIADLIGMGALLPGVAEPLGSGLHERRVP